jgi:hypothetical protein
VHLGEMQRAFEAAQSCIIKIYS